VADYTIKNLKEIEDQAPKFGLSPGIEARFARGPLVHLGISKARGRDRRRQAVGRDPGRSRDGPGL
jgi:hypothetical protein